MQRAGAGRGGRPRAPCGGPLSGLPKRAEKPARVGVDTSSARMAEKLLGAPLHARVVAIPDDDVVALVRLLVGTPDGKMNRATHAPQLEVEIPISPGSPMVIPTGALSSMSDTMFSNEIRIAVIGES